MFLSRFLEHCISSFFCLKIYNGKVPIAENAPKCGFGRMLNTGEDPFLVTFCPHSNSATS